MRVVLLEGLVLALLVTAAHGGIAFPSVVERAIGIRAGDGYFVVSGADAPWCVEAGDVELFGIAGLRVAGVRATGRVGALPVGATLTQLASPVGTETRANVELGYVPGARWRASVRVGAEMIAITGAAGEQSLVTGFLSRADVGRISAIADVDVVSRRETRDVDVTLGVVARAGRGASLVGTAHFDGTGVAAAGIAFVSRLTGALSLLAGYDDGTDSVRGAAVVSLASWRVSTGVFYHSVLGLSQGVTVAWVR